MRTVDSSSANSKSRYYGRETKYQKVRMELELLANRLGPGTKLPSIRELSVSMGASISTLSGALEEMENAGLVRRQQGKGIFVQPKLQRNILLVCDSHFFAQGHSPFWDVLVEQARIRSLVQNEHLSLHFTLPSGGSQSVLHHALVREVEEGRVQGVVGVGLDRRTARWILDHDIPYTAFASWAPYSVRLHYESLVRQGVQALASLGCRRLAFWQAAWPVYDAEGNEVAEWCDRSEVFEAAVADRGLVVDESLICTNAEVADSKSETVAVESARQQGYRNAVEAFSRPRSEWPDGIVLSEDMMTEGVLAAMSHTGVRPGIDVQIATHANKGSTNFLGNPPGIIRVEFDPAEVVQRLFELLETLMNRETPTGVRTYAQDTQVFLVEPYTVTQP